MLPPHLPSHSCPGIAIAESNTIAQYLTDKYDTEKKLTITTGPDKYVLNQWLLFQGASQGPFFAQVQVFHLGFYLSAHLQFWLPTQFKLTSA
jgi:glutathione S-transferase